jgi:hypothetical protein
MKWQWAFQFPWARRSNSRVLRYRCFSPNVSNGITNVDFTLAAADASGKPGTPLETITIDGQTISPMVYAGNSVVHPILTGGSYFLEAAIASGDFGGAGWNFANSANASGTIAGMSSSFAPPGWVCVAIRSRPLSKSMESRFRSRLPSAYWLGFWRSLR